ncbi:MAG: cache domain-containing protein [Alphaproteobacteria bacterium]|jgi:cytochrome c|nr:cache domain-containing protein [Alphaproteobacteria bacterium]
MVKRILGAIAVAAMMIAGVQAATADSCNFASPDDARLLALRASAHLDRVGPEQAFRDFMDPAAKFVDRDLYVFVLDLNGVLWASGAFPNQIGAEALDAQDASGRFFVEDMVRIAKDEGEGWVEYEMLHPCTGDLSPKVSFVKRVGGFIVGVGAYGTMSA